MMDDIRMAKKGFDKIGKIRSLLEGLDQHYFDKLLEYSEALFTFSPYKIGDVVQLVKPPEITKDYNYGWWGYREVLVGGAIGVVEQVSYRKNRFEFGIQFGANKECTFWFDETWIVKKEVK